MSTKSTIASRIVFKLKYAQIYLKERLFMIAWIVTNLCIFGYSYFKFRSDPGYRYTHQTVGHGLFISRGTASVLNFSCFIIFIPMCRTLLTLIRSWFSPKISLSPGNIEPIAESLHQQVKTKFSQIVRRTIGQPIGCLTSSLIDSSQRIHTATAYTILLSGLIHSIAHVTNSFVASTNYNHVYPQINLASFPGQHPFFIISGSVAGITGIGMNLVLTILFITSLASVRRDHFNLFKYSHYLSFIFVILILCHPLGGLLKEQINLDQHSFGCDQRLNASLNESEVQANYSLIESNSIQSQSSLTPCDPPIFQPLRSCTWIWLSISLSLYTIDISIRLWRRRRSATVIQSTINKDHIDLELVEVTGSRSIAKRSRPGQYVYLKCPQISLVEWHPFSLSSIPLSGINDTFRLSIKLNGDWTDQLAAQIFDRKNCDSLSNCQENKNGLRFYVDGPFCSPLQDILKHRIAITIAGGIGVTPFISFLSLFRSYPNILTSKSIRLEKLYFIWICRKVSNLSGFLETLSSFQTSQTTHQSPLRLTIYLTQETRETMATNIKALGSRDELMIKQVLRNQIYLGKPKVKTLFQQMSRNYRDQSVAVFCSGPPNLRREIKKTCRGLNVTGSHFIFKHEDFGI